MDGFVHFARHIEKADDLLSIIGRREKFTVKVSSIACSMYANEQSNNNQ